ncbi:hypothetical protein [Acidianus sp. HS-5]|uniref:hypothetical protein n=1 Tax=Acidianus sp. HS-5 TaxID=2886040 RepID=UPI001F2713FC|nr:hypothetical protein [Acidianus sp. HS-5]BDC18111.1 hypothetical protein HS5_10010 [Acidianus sp. HS-5]
MSLREEDKWPGKFEISDNDIKEVEDLMLKIINGDYYEVHSNNDNTHTTNYKERFNNKSISDEILDKGYIIANDKNISINTHPNLVKIPFDNERCIVTFKDTIELLLSSFSIYKEENIEDKLPKRLLPLFILLKRYGLIYFDWKERKYKLTASYK